MSNSNKKKTLQLGMPNGTAAQKLRKMIMFQLIQKLGLNTCFQCGNKIETIEELSIEHKVAWLDSNNPKELFFDLDNIAFSHLSCNCSNAKNFNKGKTKHPSISAYINGCRCPECKELTRLRTQDYSRRKKTKDPEFRKGEYKKYK